MQSPTYLGKLKNALSKDIKQQVFDSSPSITKFKVHLADITSTNSKPKTKQKPLPELKEVPSTDSALNEALFFHKYLYGNDLINKKVNSLADVGTLEAKIPFGRRRRPKYIDSEVDLLMSQYTNRPRIKYSYSDMAPKRAEKPPWKMEDIKEVTPVENEDKPVKKKFKNKGTNFDDKVDLAKRRKLKSNSDVEPVDWAAKYPVLQDKDLESRYLSVKMTNNQKGRLRQVLREMYKGTSSSELPDALNNRIQTILKTNTTLSHSDLRKIRILCNMLRKALTEIDSNEKKDSKTAKEGSADENVAEDGDKEKPKKKKKKRYVVFVGNLPVEITTTEILQLFGDIEKDIADIRIPQTTEDKKSAFAFVEIKNRLSYEIALSKHHCMVGSKRINVLYTAHKGTKRSAAEIKAKQAKLLDLQKKGKLIGSLSANKKRSQRRAKQRRALKEAELSAPAPPSKLESHGL